MVAGLVQQFSGAGWQPADTELQGLIESGVREEVLYREGMELGLDRDDISSRRVRQKVE